MSAIAIPPAAALTAPWEKTCSHPDPNMGITCMICGPCPRCSVPVMPGRMQEHEAECAELCPCNFAPYLASNNPQHCGNNCHQCWL